MLAECFTRSLYVLCHTSSLPVPTNSISLDPVVKGAWGLPATRVTFRNHENDLRLNRSFLEPGLELLGAAGATRTCGYPIDDPYPAVHLLGTCRMGNDPATPVVDRYHRTHEVPNRFVVDGGSFVTSGRGQPACTIQALPFRAGAEITRLARQGWLD